MTIETKTGEGPKTEGEGPKVDVGEVMKRLEQLQSSYDRVLEESKSNKSKAQEYRSKLEEAEKKKIDESGDVTKQLEYERKARTDKESEVKELKNSILSQKVRETVGKYAKDVHDLDDFLNQPNFSHILKSGIDKEKLSVDENAAKDYVNKVLEAKPWLKKHTQSAGVDSTRPNSTGTIKSLTDLGEVKKGDHKDLMKSALTNW